MVTKLTTENYTPEFGDKIIADLRENLANARAYSDNGQYACTSITKMIRRIERVAHCKRIGIECEVLQIVQCNDGSVHSVENISPGVTSHDSDGINTTFPVEAVTARLNAAGNPPMSEKDCYVLEWVHQVCEDHIQDNDCETFTFSAQGLVNLLRKAAEMGTIREFTTSAEVLPKSDESV